MHQWVRTSCSPAIPRRQERAKRLADWHKERLEREAGGGDEPEWQREAGGAGEPEEWRRVESRQVKADGVATTGVRVPPLRPAVKLEAQVPARETESASRDSRDQIEPFLRWLPTLAAGESELVAPTCSLLGNAI